MVALDTPLHPAAPGVLQVYFRIYAHRAKKRSGAPFESIEPDCLAALAVVRDARRVGHRASADALKALDAYTRDALEKGIQHSVAVDIAGLAWAEAYGHLPLDDPPHDVLEWVLVRGAAPGAVGGLAAGAWRLLALLTALPLYSHAQRSNALKETRRWLDYVHGKLDAQEQEFDLSLRALRLTYVLAASGDLADSEPMVDAARALLHPILACQEADGRVRHPQTGGEIATAHAAQVALAALALGRREPAVAILNALLNERRDPKTGLLQPDAEASDRGEMSPWVALALVGALEHDPRPPVNPLRRLATTVRERAGRPVQRVAQGRLA